MQYLDTDRRIADITTASRMLGLPIETLRKRLQRGRAEGFKAEDGTWRIVLDSVTPVSRGQIARDSLQNELQDEVRALRLAIDELRVEVRGIAVRIDEAMQQAQHTPFSAQHTSDDDSSPMGSMVAGASDEQMKTVLLAVLEFLKRAKAR